MEVDADLASTFAREFGAGVVEGRFLDLAAACASQFEGVGIPRGNIYKSDECTVCSDDYFSHRGDAGCGRQGAFATIRR
jgi:copper oxidase (laccase) domain-containing protein